MGGRKRSRSSAEVEDDGDASEAEDLAQPVDFHGIAGAAVSSAAFPLLIIVKTCSSLLLVHCNAIFGCRWSHMLKCMCLVEASAVNCSTSLLGLHSDDG